MESAHANRRIIVMELRTSPFVLTGRATSVNAHRAKNIRCNYGAATARNPEEDERKRTSHHFIKNCAKREKCWLRPPQLVHALARVTCKRLCPSRYRRALGT